jgi:hypothetical protein
MLFKKSTPIVEFLSGEGIINKGKPYRQILKEIGYTPKQWRRLNFDKIKKAANLFNRKWDKKHNL